MASICTLLDEGTLHDTVYPFTPRSRQKQGRGKSQTMLFGPIGPPLATQQCCDVGVLMTHEWLDADSAMLPAQRCFSDATCTMMFQ